MNDLWLPAPSATATTLAPDPNDKHVIAHTYQDCEPVLEHNNDLRKLGQKSDWGRHMAQIPNNILNKWLVEEWERGNLHLRLHSPEWMELVWKKLQDPDWAYLRVDKQPSGYARMGWTG
jgi:hypothetical protein